MNYHTPREIIDVISVMYLKSQNLMRNLDTMDEEEVQKVLDDLKEHAKQVVSQ